MKRRLIAMLLVFTVFLCTGNFSNAAEVPKVSANDENPGIIDSEKEEETIDDLQKNEESEPNDFQKGEEQNRIIDQDSGIIYIIQKEPEENKNGKVAVRFAEENREPQNEDYGYLIIPETIEHNQKRYDVNSIEKDALADFESLKGILIPDMVLQIDEEVFREHKEFSIYCNEGSYAKEYAEKHEYDCDTDSIKMSMEENELKIGSKVQINLQIAEIISRFSLSEWTSDNEQVGTVSEKGEITLISSGKTDISVKIAGLKATKTITVPEGGSGTEKEKPKTDSDQRQRESTSKVQNASIALNNVVLQGQGTEDSPYQITTQQELAAISEIGYNPMGVYYIELKNNITITSDTWQPISLFYGATFNGNGYTVTGLNMNTANQSIGLFGSNNGTIRNLKVQGNLVGEYGGILCTYNYGTIENCSVSGSVNFPEINSGTGVYGGLVGSNWGNIIQCSSSAEVRGSSSNIGGLVGENGGIIRYSHTGTSAAVTGILSNMDSYGGIGGLAGRNSGTVEYSYAQNSVSVSNPNGNLNNVGGLIGYHSNGTIKGCYATGVVNNEEGAGLVGKKESGSILCSYYNSINSGNNYGFAASLTNLKVQGTYYGWNFANIWSINGGYPYINLQGKVEPAGIGITGNGTEADPYVIKTEAQLFALNDFILTEEMPVGQDERYFILGNDIVITGKDWSPIGTSSNPFRSTFDGKGFSISGIEVNVSNCEFTGLFGYNSGTIRNVKVNGNIKGSMGSNGETNIGILCGLNGGTITNCQTSGTITATRVQQYMGMNYSYCGGAIGKNIGTVEKCYSDVAINNSNFTYAGGLIGYNSSNIRYSHAKGNITTEDTEVYHVMYTGGLVGFNNCGVIEYCYAQNAITSMSSLGGLVGGSESGIIKYCYAAGIVNDVNGYGNNSGLVGYSNNEKIWYSYYNAVNNGNRYGFAVSDTQLKEQSTYYGWDFTHIWVMGEGGYPQINLSGEPEKIQIEGTGTKVDPYMIKNEQQLFAIVKGELPLVSGTYYVLGNDITITSGNWTSIGNSTGIFEGIFDGAGYTIRGMKTSGTSYNYLGLFGYNKGTIRNLTVEGTVEGSGSYAGILCGYNGSGGLIENCRVSGTVSSSGSHGGLVGRNEYGTIKHCGVQGEVSGSSYAGGLVGYNTYGTIESSYAQNVVNGTGSNVGGLVGYNTYGTVKYCYSAGIVNEGKGGGLVGSNANGNVWLSYYNSQNKGNAYGFAASESELKQQNTYDSWDFLHIWKVEGSYPFIHLNGEPEAVEISGDGTEENPYVIENEDQLFAMSQNKIPIRGKKHYILSHDITITRNDLKPIGTWGNAFDGVLDGKGRTIRGIQDTALFGCNDGTISNLKVEGNVEGNGGYAGILCGYNDKNGIIQNCKSDGIVNSAGIAGGLAGYNDGTITQCNSDAAVIGVNYVGGLIGDNRKTIRYCYAMGSVKGGNYVGGLCGYSSEGAIEYSYAQNLVTGSSNTGGLIGCCSGGSVKFCYASGSVNQGLGGGLVGASVVSGNGGNIWYCYYNSVNTGNKYGYAVSVSELKQKDTYYGWDFEHSWAIDGSYPYICLNGNTEAVEISGNGTSSSPYVIENEKQLLALTKGELPITGSKYYVLGNNITITGNYWTPIGTQGSIFNGTFDGKGYTIRNMKTVGTNYNYLGLFGYNGGTIRNLTVEGNIEGYGNYAGVLCGYNTGTIENCKTSGTVTSSGNHGGLIGYNSRTVTQSSSTAKIGGSGSAGGLVGYNNGTSAIIRRSYALGNVINEGSYTGGLVGDNYNGTIENSYARNTVTGKSYTGGIVGNNYSGSMKNCYSSGGVKGESRGGLIGRSYGSSKITSSYYCEATSGCTDTDKGQPLTKEQMEMESSYDGWDFIGVWGIYNALNEGLPFFLYQAGELEVKEGKFWYDVVENKKGYAAFNQKMKLYVAEDSSNVVTICLTYVKDGITETKDIETLYDATDKIFTGVFDIVQGIEEITSVSALVETEKSSYSMQFTPSFWYQMPLKVEGTITAKFKQATADSENMLLKLFNAENKSVFKQELSGNRQIDIGALPSGEYKAVLYGNDLEYAAIENIIVLQGSNTVVDFTEISGMANLEAAFYSEDSRIYNSGIKVIFYDKTEGKSRLLGNGTWLSCLAEGDTIGYSLQLDSNMSKVYKADTTIYSTVLNEGDNTVKVNLKRFQNAKLKGTIVDADTNSPIAGVKVNATQKLNGVHSNNSSATTSSFGTFTLDLKDEDTIISLSKNGYTTVTQTIKAKDLGDDITLTLEKAKGRVEFSVLFMKSVLETENSQANYDVTPDEIALYNVTTGKTISDYQKSWPIVYVSDTQMKNGDKIEARISKNGYATAKITATVNTDGNIKFSGRAYQLGGVKFGISRKDNQEGNLNQVAIYNNTGEKVYYKNYLASICSVNNLEAGSYTVIVADQGSIIPSYHYLSEFSENASLVTQYEKQEIIISDGVILEADAMNVPSEGKVESILKVDESRLNANAAYAMIGDTLTIRAEFVLADTDNSTNKKAVVSVPNGTRLVEDSFVLTAGNKNSFIQNKELSIENNKITIDITEKSTIIRYQVKVLDSVAASALEFTGGISYKLDGKPYSEIAGRAEILLNDLTLHVPEQTKYSDIIARGIAEKNAKIEIYDDGILIGQTTANKYGSYRVEVSLIDKGNYTTHRIQAKNSGSGDFSNICNLIYGETEPSITKVNMTHNGKRYEMNEPTKEIASHILTMIPEQPFEFDVYFDKSQAVDLVRVLITLTDGRNKVLYLSYNESLDCWDGETKLNSNQVPTGISVSYWPLEYYAMEEDNIDTDLFEGVSVSLLDIKHNSDDGQLSYEEKLELNDIEQTAVFGMMNLKENVTYTPSGNEMQMEYKGAKIYILPNFAVVQNGNRCYAVTECYIQQKDGSYMLWQRGIGFENLEQNTEEGLKTLLDNLYKDINETQRCTELSRISKDVKRLTESLTRADASASMDIKDKITAYRDELTGYLNLDAEQSYFDMIYEYVQYSDGEGSFNTKDLDILKKFEELIGKEAGTDVAKEEIKFMKSIKNLIKTYYIKNFENLVGKINKDSDIKNALKELEKENDTDKSNRMSEDDGFSISRNREISKINTIIDPSGYVYELFEDNRIEGVTATLYFENDDGIMQLWDAEEYNQVNPQLTDADGNYAWDVPEGWWQVQYSKEGYETVTSKKMKVPPPQLDVNISMVSKLPAKISKIMFDKDLFQITFDRYVQTDTLTKGSIFLKMGETEIPVKIVLNSESVRKYEGTDIVKEITLQPAAADSSLENGVYSIEVNDTIKTYAGVKLNKSSVNYVLDKENAAIPLSISIPENVRAYRGGTLITSDDFIYQNDILKIEADVPNGKQLQSIKVNGESIINGGYYTVGQDDVTISVMFETVSTPISIKNNSLSKVYGDTDFSLSDEAGITNKANVSLYYESLDKNLVTVNEETGLVSIKGAGTTDVIVWSGTTNRNAEAKNTITINIGKGTPEFTAPTGLTATYGQTLRDVALPDGFTFEAVQTTSVGDSGNNKFKVKYTPTDTSNYNVVTGIETIINVGKAAPDFTAPTGLVATYGQTLKNVPLPNGFTFEEAQTTSVGKAGNNKFKVKYTPIDTNNYDVVTGIETTISVGKATPSYTAPTGLVATYGQTLKDVTLPDGFTFEEAQTTSVGSTGDNKFRVTYTPTDVDNYYIVTGIEVMVAINAKMIINAVVSDIPNQIYTGKAIKPEITVKDGDVVLKNEMDYTLSYKDNISVGTAEIIITFKNKYAGTVKKIFIIKNPALINQKIPQKGEVYTVGNFKYEITKSATDSGTVMLISPIKKPAKVNIPKTVQIKGNMFHVTGIAAKAFRNNKKLKTVIIQNTVFSIGKDAFVGCTSLKKVTMGTGIKEIGKNAFSGDKKLKTIIIKSAKLSMIGKNAFKNIHKKATIKVPKKKWKTYKKLLRGKGQKSSVSIKK